MTTPESQPPVFLGVLLVLCSTLALGQSASPQSVGTLDEARPNWSTPLTSPTLGVTDLPRPRVVTPPASYSLSLSGDVKLGGFVFKNGSAFLHNDGGPSYRNTAVGLDALINLTPGVPTFGRGGLNTATGFEALHSTTEGTGNVATGALALYANLTGFDNTAIGTAALKNNTSGYFNTAVGALAMHLNVDGKYNVSQGQSSLRYNLDGSKNSAIGHAAMWSNETGERNIALGYRAGTDNVSGSDNIWIGNPGVVPGTDSNTLRIGSGTASDDFHLLRTFIAGIRGVTTGEEDAVAVLIDSKGQLGTVSSSRRVKQDISDMNGSSSGLHRLRPVTFRYRRPYGGDSKPVRYGLIAEEVAEIFPNLVAYDDSGQPETVLYHLLDAIIINEVQKHASDLVAHQSELSALRRRVAQQEATLREQGELLVALAARLDRMESEAAVGAGRSISAR